MVRRVILLIGRIEGALIYILQGFIMLSSLFLYMFKDFPYKKLHIKSTGVQEIYSCLRAQKKLISDFQTDGSLREELFT